MKISQLFTADKIVKYIPEEYDDKVCIQIQRDNKNMLIDIYQLSPSDIMLVLLKTGFNYFSRYIKLRQQITSYEDIKDVVMLATMGDKDITLLKIFQHMKYIDPLHLFVRVMEKCQSVINDGNRASLTQIIDEMIEDKKIHPEAHKVTIPRELFVQLVMEERTMEYEY